MNNGIITNLPNQDYHALPSLSHSLCKWLEPQHAPLQFWHRSWLNPNRVFDGDLTASKNTGRLLHLAMEDLEQFRDTIGILPGVKVTKRPDCIGGAPGGQLEALLTLRHKLMAIPDVRRAMEEGTPEVSLLANTMGVDVRCRPDLLAPDLEIHWKFTGRMDRLRYVIDDFRYIEGVSWYRRVRRAKGLKDIRQALVICEWKAPYEIRWIEPSSYHLDEADIYGHRALNRFKELSARYKDLMWPDYRLTPQGVCTAAAGGSSDHSVHLPPAYDRRLAA